MNEEFFKWSDQYSIGLNVIDQQHKQLIEIINQLHNFIKQKQSNDEVKNILKQMFDYTEFHFKAEERYFKLYNYEKTDSHIKQHQIYIDKIKEFQKDLTENNISITYRLLGFLKNWLIEHIQGVDKEYVQCFKLNGVK